jgi:hypothetical protein
MSIKHLRLTCSPVMSSPRSQHASIISRRRGRLLAECDEVMWQIWSFAPVAATSAMSSCESLRSLHSPRWWMYSTCVCVRACVCVCVCVCVFVCVRPSVRPCVRHTLTSRPHTRQMQPEATLGQAHSVRSYRVVLSTLLKHAVHLLVVTLLHVRDTHANPEPTLVKPL